MRILKNIIPLLFLMLCLLPAKAQEAAIPCMLSFDPVVWMSNPNSTELDHITLYYRIDGGERQSLEWTGWLESNDSVSLSLPTVPVLPGIHTLEVYLGAAEDISLPPDFRWATSFPYTGCNEPAQMHWGPGIAQNRDENTSANSSLSAMGSFNIVPAMPQAGTVPLCPNCMKNAPREKAVLSFWYYLYQSDVRKTEVQVSKDDGHSWSQALWLPGGGEENTTKMANSNTLSAASTNPVEEGFHTMVWPNPFYGGTTISYTLPKESVVDIKVHNLYGKQLAHLVKATQHKAGEYRIRFDAAELPPGLYFYTLGTGSYTQTKKLIVR